MNRLAPITTALLLAIAPAALADVPQIIDATATEAGGVWRFDVTVAHPDTGWDHYADGWRVCAPDGTELGYRELLHPHETEQPFTRSLSGVAVPPGLTQVILRAHDSVHGTGPDYVLDLPR